MMTREKWILNWVTDNSKNKRLLTRFRRRKSVKLTITFSRLLIKRLKSHTCCLLASALWLRSQPHITHKLHSGTLVLQFKRKICSIVFLEYLFFLFTHPQTSNFGFQLLEKSRKSEICGTFEIFNVQLQTKMNSVSICLCTNFSFILTFVSTTQRTYFMRINYKALNCINKLSIFTGNAWLNDFHPFFPISSKCPTWKIWVRRSLDRWSRNCKVCKRMRWRESKFWSMMRM